MTDKELISFFEEFGETFPKLIRDKIPELIIANEGKPAVTKRATEYDELIKLIKRKVVEEAMELFSYDKKADLISGIADVVEVIEKLKKSANISTLEINTFRKYKNKKYGGFKNSVILVSKE